MQEIKPSLSTVETLTEEKTAIYLLPSDATHVIVQTKPSLAISCIMPTTKKQVQVDFYDVGGETVVDTELDIPTLIWTQLFVRWKDVHREDFCRCMRCNYKDSLKSVNRKYNGSNNFYRYFLNAIDIERCSSQEIFLAEYNVANIDHSYVCWGKNVYPCSIRQGNFIFWSSILNNSPGRYCIDERNRSKKEVSEILARKMREYRPTNFRNKKPFIFGEHFMASSQKTTGILVSLDSQLLSKYPDSALDNERVVQGCEPIKAIIGFANRDASHATWNIDLNGESFVVEESQLTIL